MAHSIIKLCYHKLYIFEPDHFEIFKNKYSKKVSKQMLYFVKESYEIFSTQVSAKEKQGQNSGEPHQGVIGSLGISPAVRPFWICSPVGEYLSLNVPYSSLFIVQFLFLPSSFEVSLRKQFQKTPGKCRISWRLSSRAAPNRMNPVVLSIKHLALPSFCAILFMIQTFKVYQLVHRTSILANEVIYNGKGGLIVS